MAADMAALKNWVTAADGEQFSRLPEGVVSVNISHSNITARMIELKFDLIQTVGTRTDGLSLPTERPVPVLCSLCFLMGLPAHLLVGLFARLFAGLVVGFRVSAWWLVFVLSAWWSVCSFAYLLFACLRARL